jgi:3-methylfumaryl-CoA hydratase
VTADDPRAWIGRITEAEDVATAGPVRRLAALLDHEAPPWLQGVVPPLGHWLYFLPQERQALLATDGHSPRGGFLPPTALPRRMWAGGRVEFHRPIEIGAAIGRRSTIEAVAAKRGASGELLFVTIRHQIRSGGALAVLEEQDLVFCSKSAAVPNRATQPPAAEPDPDSRRAVSLGPVELFRFSALTFNAHRIHYDRDYARSVEGYRGLVVHGPYVAVLLLDHYLRACPQAPVARLSYRAQSPLFESERFELCSRATASGASLWARSAGDAIAMRAEVTL